MTVHFSKSVMALILMLCAATLGILLRPVYQLADQRPTDTLDVIIPTAFGDWSEEKQASAQIIDPLQKEKINKLYSQTLSRTYKNGNGYRIMLSIAYGINQRDSMQVHKPEICYPAQGFVLHSQEATRINLNHGSIPAVRILTSQGLRIEPVTYWITLGDQVVSSAMQKKLTELKYAIHRTIPDGMLIRVSSIDAHSEQAYVIQSQFSRSLVDSISPSAQRRFVGNSENN